jgi:hypothetical protein
MVDVSDAATLLGLLADDARRKVLAALLLGAATTDDVVAMTGLDTRAVATALHRFASAALVDDDRGAWSVRADLFTRAAREASQLRDEELPEVDEPVLRNFLRDGRLVSIPASHAKRLVVLDFLAGQFEPGHVYPERDVNFLLMKFHPDCAALRRYLVDDGFLERRDGFYWRAGGTFDVDDEDEPSGE